MRQHWVQPTKFLGTAFQVLKKAYIEEKSNDGLPDSAAATLAWDNHKKRNQSIIVESLQVGWTTVCCRFNAECINVD